MRKSLGSKRKELSPEHIDAITRLFGNFEEAEQDGKPISKIFRNEDFGYRTITVERPLRDEAGNVSTDTQKVLTADTKKSSLLGGIFPFVSTMGWVIAWGC
jgi:type I restriction-modification system DNA methylase subunit